MSPSALWSHLTFSTRSSPYPAPTTHKTAAGWRLCTFPPCGAMLSRPLKTVTLPEGCIVSAACFLWWASVTFLSHTLPPTPCFLARRAAPSTLILWILGDPPVETMNHSLVDFLTYNLNNQMCSCNHILPPN